jgi:hypothetical protein
MNKHHPSLQKYIIATRKFLEQLPAEEIERLNQKTFNSIDIEYQKFQSSFENGLCYLCGEKIENFILNKPCIHWLLRPAGFAKKYFPLVYKNFNYLRIQSYLRWVANTEIIAGNINDLEEEKNPEKIFEYTIKYKNLEWSFSCADGDLTGHKFSFYGRFPHYHFQMRIDNRSFIGYSNFHIPFTKEDLFCLPIILGTEEKATYTHAYGAGMQEMTDVSDPEKLLSSMTRADDQKDGVYSVQTFIEVEPGKTLSGDEIVALFKKSKEMNVPMAQLVKKLKNVGSAKTIISPGPRVPNQAGRKNGKRK